MTKSAEPENILCPFCGVQMDAAGRFCVSCGRAGTAADLRRASLKLQAAKPRTEGGGVDISRRDFTIHRQSRSLLYTISAILAIVIAYYGLMKFVLHEHMPGNLDAKIEQLLAGTEQAGASINNAAASAPGTAPASSAVSASATDQTAARAGKERHR